MDKAIKVNHGIFKFASPLFVTVFAFLLLIGCAKQRRFNELTIEKGVLSVGVEVGYPPMEYFDDDGVTLMGFDIELTKALAAKLNLKVQYIDTAWEGIFAGLDTYQYDVAVNIVVLPEREKRYNFTRPYIDSSICMVTLRDSSIKIENPRDIAGYRVAYQGDTTAHYFTERQYSQGVDFLPFSYDKILNCFDDLILERVDVVVTDNLVAFDYMGKENSPFTIAWQGHSNEMISLCLKKGNDALTIALDNALNELFLDGTMKKISEKLFNRDLVSSLRDDKRAWGVQ